MSDTAVLRHYLAPILPLLEPVEVTELVINKPGEVGIEDHLGWHWHNVAELDSEWLATLAVALPERRAEHHHEVGALLQQSPGAQERVGVIGRQRAAPEWLTPKQRAF